MKLSVILPTYNRSAMVVNTLRSLVKMEASSDQWECIIVNNNSTDDTEQVVASFLQTLPAGYNFKLVTETEQGLSAARNRGYNESKGEYIVFIDDDETVNTQFADAYIHLFETLPEAGAASGKVIPEYPAGKPLWLSPLTEKPIACPVDLGNIVKPYPSRRHPAGGNLALRRSVLEQTGVFNTALGRKGGSLVGGEEYELIDRVRAAGFSVFYTPDAVIWHIIGTEKLTDAYFDHLTCNIGVGQKRRTANMFKLCISEIVKWCVVLPLSTFYCLSGRCLAARYLLRMRRNVSQGIFTRQH